MVELRTFSILPRMEELTSLKDDYQGAPIITVRNETKLKQFDPHMLHYFQIYVGSIPHHDGWDICSNSTQPSSLHRRYRSFCG